MHNRKKLLFIMNPKAGVMLAPKNLASIVERFSGSGFLTQVLMTTGRGDARDFAAEYGGESDIVVVSGGDGTLNEVIDGLLSEGLKTPIGYIPAGSTNDFANSIGLPRSIADCVERIISGTPKPVDIGSFNGRYFSYVASFGAFTSVTYTVPQNLKNIFGHTAYVMGGINELAKLKSIHTRITLEPGTPEEQVHEGDYVLGAISNSRSIGGILNLDKLDVDMNDGVMEVMMIKMPKDLIELSDIAASTLGGTFKSHQIETYSAKNIMVELDENTHWTLDGEYEKGSGVCEIKTLESAISLIR
ncbi:MAG: YegS/Rv2252/BmrU family lipid kinase [Clostridiales bacterium]|nr:YegS/Rv2252/BmrU family lipid kinase [Clostridiales bacterium]